MSINLTNGNSGFELEFDIPDNLGTTVLFGNNTTYQDVLRYILYHWQMYTGGTHNSNRISPDWNVKAENRHVRMIFHLPATGVYLWTLNEEEFWFALSLDFYEREFKITNIRGRLINE